VYNTMHIRKCGFPSYSYWKMSCLLHYLCVLDIRLVSIRNISICYCENGIYIITSDTSGFFFIDLFRRAVDITELSWYKYP
jgi:hypothetical protein